MLVTIAYWVDYFFCESITSCCHEGQQVVLQADTSSSVHKGKHCWQVKGGDLSPLLSPSEAQCPALGSQDKRNIAMSK